MIWDVHLETEAPAGWLLLPHHYILHHSHLFLQV